MRLPIIDGFRGGFLLFMMVIHTNDEVNSILGKLNHHYFGWVEDAQGFIFISGLVVGMVYGGRLIGNGFGTVARQIWRRMRSIYLHHAALIAVFLMAAALFTQVGRDTLILAPYQTQPWSFGAASLALVSASEHMGILPMYIFFLASAPFVLWTLHQGHWRAVMLTSAALWALGQTGLGDAMADGVTAWFGARGIALQLGLFFNLLAWQVIFCAGLTFGYLYRAGQLDLTWLTTTYATRWAILGALLVLAFGIFDRIVYWELISPAFSREVLSFAVRADLSLLHLANFAVDLYVVAWLVIAGPHCGLPLVAALARLTRNVLCWGPLVMLGQHALRLFTYHLLCVYAVALALNGRAVDELTATLVVLSSVALLFGLGAFEQWRRQRTSLAPASTTTSRPLANSA